MGSDHSRSGELYSEGIGDRFEADRHCEGQTERDPLAEFAPNVGELDRMRTYSLGCEDTYKRTSHTKGTFRLGAVLSSSCPPFAEFQ